MVDGMRYQVLYGFSLSEAATSLGVAAVVAVLGLWFAVSGIRRRIESGGV